MKKKSSQLLIPFPQYQVSEIEVSYRPGFRATDRPKVDCSEAAHELFRSGWNPDTIAYHESGAVMYLNRGNRLLGIYYGFSGGISGCIMDVKMACAIGLKLGASAYLMAHNHPSGNLQPSEADVRLTTVFKEAGELLTMPLIDSHILDPYDSYLSFADEGRRPF